MNHAHLLIPFALPPAEHARDLVNLLTKECGTDGLAMLLSRHSAMQLHHMDDFAQALPHEVWHQQTLQTQSQLTLLQQQAQQLGVTLDPGYWFMLNPVHLHIASTHLVLTDQRQLTLTEEEASVLFDIARQACELVGITLKYGSPGCWFLRADHWHELSTSTPDAACGHNIDIWLPQGPTARAWRKLQNEIQMEWFMHPLQQQREQRGLQSVNGLWIWSGTSLPRGCSGSQQTPAPDSVQHWIAAPRLMVLDSLSSAALASDWGTWVQQFIALEHNWFKPLHSALKKGQLSQYHLHLSNSNRLLNLHNTRQGLHKFWRSPTLKSLSK